MTARWLDLPADHLFGLATLPYGVFSTSDPDLRRVGVRIGDFVLDRGLRPEVGWWRSCPTRPTVTRWEGAG